MSKPIITYVIPCYNCEDTVADTVSSIRDTHEFVMVQQGKKSLWKEMEIILINDGSTDYTGDIITALAKNESNIRTLSNDGNYGRGYTRNKGNQDAKADIIAVLDADDLNLQDRTGQILKSFSNNVEADLFYSSFLAHHVYLGKDVRKEAFPIDENYIKDTGQFGICHSTVAYRREVILRHPYSEEKDEDDWFMLWNLFVNKCKFIYSNKPLVSYMINIEDIEKEFAEGKQESILKKKQAIMEPYFNKKEIANVE